MTTGGPWRQCAGPSLFDAFTDKPPRFILNSDSDSAEYRLAEASRALVLVVQRRYADATGRMQAALQAAEEMRTSSAAAAQDKNRELSERTGVAEHVLTLLDQAGKTTG